MKVSHFFKAGVVALAVAVAGIVATSPALAKGSLENINVPGIRSEEQQIFTDLSKVVYVEGSVVLDNTSRASLYNFVADLENDPLWYVGTLSSERISGNGGPGTKYVETVAFGPTPVQVTATVLYTQPNNRFIFTSDSFLTNLTEYRVKNRPQGKAELTIRSLVQLPEGFTEEQLVGYLELVLNTLPGAMGTTGTVTIES